MKIIFLRSLLNTISVLLFFYNPIKTSQFNQTNVLGNKPPLYEAKYKFFEINNLRCLYIQNTKMTRSYVSMAVDCGSQHDTIPGLAHLLEHLLFLSPEQDTQSNENKRINEFESFVGLYAGSSNATTWYEMTVFHYELDSRGLGKSLEIFANFFKNPKITPATVESVIKMVDSEFQNYKYDETRRYSRLRDKLDGKSFTTGNINSFGSDYEQIARDAKDLHEKYYKKMVLVISSELPFDEIKPILDENFTMPLEEVVYKERMCLYCEKETKNSDEYLKINKLHKLKAITDRKRVYISIPLILKYLLPMNIYKTLSFYFEKSDHTSFEAKLKSKNLAIDVNVEIDTRHDCDLLIFNITVDDTRKYEQILPIVRYYLNYFKKNSARLSDESQCASKMAWKLSQDASPQDHVQDCARSLLKSNILFSGQIRDHDCPNITFDECNIILIDKNFEIKECSDEYELYYEEITDFERWNIEFKEDFCEIIQSKYSSQTRRIYDKTNNSHILSIKKENSEMLIVTDNFKSPEIHMRLFFHFDVTHTDKVKFLKFSNDIYLLYDSIFSQNGISFNWACDNNGFEICLSVIDPLFILINIVDKIEIGILEDEETIRTAHAYAKSFKFANGHIRAANYLNN